MQQLTYYTYKNDAVCIIAHARNIDHDDNNYLELKTRNNIKKNERTIS